MTTQVDAGSRTVSINSWGPENRSFQVAGGVATEARVRTFYYPHWKATANGKDLSVRPDTDGVILISLPPEATSVELEFREPIRSRVSAATSAAGWCLIVVLALFPVRRKRLPDVST